MNHRSVLQFQVSKTRGSIVHWWNNLNHGELMETFVEDLLDLDSSGVVVDNILFFTLLIE